MGPALGSVCPAGLISKLTRALSRAIRCCSLSFSICRSKNVFNLHEISEVNSRDGRLVHIRSNITTRVGFRHCKKAFALGFLFCNEMWVTLDFKEYVVRRRRAQLHSWIASESNINKKFSIRSDGVLETVLE